MDDFYCRYGFLTTHGRTWFVKRARDNHFLVSKGIKADSKATEDSLSLRECFLFFGHLARVRRGSGKSWWVSQCNSRAHKAMLTLDQTTRKGANYFPRPLFNRPGKRIRKDSSDSGDQLEQNTWQEGEGGDGAQW